MTKSWLRKHNLDFIEKSITQPDIAKELMSMGYRSTPVIVIGNRLNPVTVVGFNTRKLAAALNLSE